MMNRSGFEPPILKSMENAKESDHERENKKDSVV